MVNLHGIKKSLKNVVSTLSPDKKAELYFQDRKQYIKLGMQGEPKKALELLKRNDRFYDEHYREDPNSFHLAHHKFLKWSHDYTYFQHQQGIIAFTDREKIIYESHLEIIETLEYCLKVYKEYCLNEQNDKEFSDFFDHMLVMVSKFKIRLNNEVRSLEDVIPEIEKIVEDNEHFKEHDYFQDIDSIGYKNLTWDKFYNQMEILRKNPPIKSTSN